jgi:hypothetical protein
MVDKSSYQISHLASPSTIMELTEREREQQERRAVATKWGNDVGKAQVEKNLRTAGKESVEQMVERLEKGAVGNNLESVVGNLKKIKGQLKKITAELKTNLSEEVEEAKKERQTLVDALRKVFADQMVVKEKMNADLTREREAAENRSNELQEEERSCRIRRPKLKIADSIADALDERINKPMAEKTDVEEGKRAAEKSVQDLNVIVVCRGKSTPNTSTNASRTISEIQYRCIPDKVSSLEDRLKYNRALRDHLIKLQSDIAIPSDYFQPVVAELRELEFDNVDPKEA